MSRESRDAAGGLQTVYGLRPVEELLEARPGAIERILASREKTRGVGPLLKRARRAGIPVTYLARDLLRKRVGGAHHQGVAALVAPRAYVPLDRLAAQAAARPDGILVFLDRVVDAGNVGSILRTAAAAGAAGAILSAEGTAGLGPAAAKASAGVLERIPVARSARPSKDLAGLRERGFRILGLDAGGETRWDRADLSGRIVLVAGGEERGMRPGVREACDARIAIPLAAGVESLNVAIALGVLLFEALRRRTDDGCKNLTRTLPDP